MKEPLGAKGRLPLGMQPLYPAGLHRQRLYYTMPGRFFQRLYKGFLLCETTEFPRISTCAVQAFVL